MMPETQLHAIARQMFERNGLGAIAQAAQNALACESKGDTEQAKEWRHIEDAIKIMRGPHQADGIIPQAYAVADRGCRFAVEAAAGLCCVHNGRAEPSGPDGLSCLRCPSSPGKWVTLKADLKIDRLVNGTRADREPVTLCLMVKRSWLV